MSSHALVADSVRRRPTRDSDHARPIRRNEPPIAVRSGAIPLKLLRRAARWLKTALASVRFTVVAAKSRRLQRELALRGVHYPRAPSTRAAVRVRA
jgi:hypothetical protein